MRFAFMTFSCPELTFPEVLQVAQCYGYDGVELRVDAKHQHGVEPETTAAQRRRFCQQAADAGIQLAAIATSCRFADPRSAGEHYRRALQCIALAAEIGAPCVRIFGGAPGQGMDRHDAVKYMADMLRVLAEDAHAKKVTLCFETHDAWCNPVDVATVIKTVNHPGLAVNWDIMHPVRTKNATIDQSFATLQPWIRHVHVHDGVTRDGKLELVPIGQGEIDHRRAMALLAGAGYDGFISGEWIAWSEPYDVHLPRELATLKHYLTEG